MNENNEICYHLRGTKHNFIWSDGSWMDLVFVTSDRCNFIPLIPSPLKQNVFPKIEENRCGSEIQWLFSVCITDQSIGLFGSLKSLSEQSDRTGEKDMSISSFRAVKIVLKVKTGVCWSIWSKTISVVPMAVISEGNIAGGRGFSDARDGLDRVNANQHLFWNRTDPQPDRMES
jgi:hypothetical protein